MYPVWSRESGVNKSFVHWTVIESMHQGCEFEMGLGYNSEPCRQILCPYAANILVGEDDNKYKLN